MIDFLAELTEPSFPLMRPLLSACLTAFLALSLGLGAPGERCAKAQQGPSVEPGQTFTGKVAEVTDGDTFKLRRPTGGDRYRTAVGR